VKLAMNINPDVWSVETDPAELELALVNVAVNARDAMPSGGSLIIGTRNVALQDAGPNQITGEFVALSLTDNGTGIPVDVLSKVFEPFFTTKEVGKGTGLGLSQVYGFARQGGGDAQITSVPGEGTTVTIYLPRSHAVCSPVVTPQAVNDDDIRGKGTILVVEDNTQVGDVSTLLLEQLGYRVRRTERPHAALALLAEENDVVLVFSDIVMPGDMDGLKLAREIQDRYPGLPVLLTTGYSSAAERVGTQFPIVRKPYDYRILATAVKTAVAAGSVRQSAVV